MSLPSNPVPLLLTPQDGAGQHVSPLDPEEKKRLILG
jgi:hypothetical protein